MAKKWYYAEATSHQVGSMICTACRQKIVIGQFRYRETEDAYLPQHRICSLGDPEWIRIAECDQERSEFYARRKAALVAFIREYGEPDRDDIEEASAAIEPPLLWEDRKMAGDIVLQLRDTRYPGQLEMRLAAAEEIEHLRLEHQHACQEIGVAIEERDQARAALRAARREEPVAWQYRAMFDKGSLREDEWCPWRDAGRKYFDKLNAEIAAGATRVQTRALYAYPQPAVAVIETNVREQVAEGAGGWDSCSGCYETVDGQDTGHFLYSDAFRCHLGSGCHECGGIGAVWIPADVSEGDIDRHPGARVGPDAELALAHPAESQGGEVPLEMTPSEHIEEWKRFARAYMRWASFNFDRIASDVVKKHSLSPAPPQHGQVEGGK